MKDDLLLFGIRCGKRYTTRQKNMFIHVLSQRLKQMGVELQVEKSMIHGQPIMNLIVGQIQSHTKVLFVGYDTPLRKIMPFSYFPLDDDQNRKMAVQKFCWQGLFIILLCIVLILGYILVRDFFVLVAFLVIILLYFLFIGFANPVNMNQNSAALVLAIELCPYVKQHDVAIVFVDHTCQGNLGYQAFYSYHQQIQQGVFLDALGSGDTLCIASYQATDLSTMMSKEMKIKVISNFLMHRKVNVSGVAHPTIICSGHVVDHQLVSLHVGKSQDYEVDTQRLINLQQILEKWIKKDDRNETDH